MSRPPILRTAAITAAILTSALPFAATDAAAVSACGTPSTGYGRMFPTLDAATWSDGAVTALGTASIAPADAPVPRGQVDPEDNGAIPSGYTYFGQFVDHDLTRDDRPDDLVTPTPVESLVNGRTPQLDLDSLYGNGPTGSPQLYEADGMHMKVGSALTGSSDSGSRDLPRDTNGRALIGDARNDENRIVAAIHSSFLRYHNAVVDRIRAQQPNLASTAVFAAARRTVTWDYQWIVMEDYLPKIVGRPTMSAVATHDLAGWHTNLRSYDSCQQMPVEFSVAAYRFGHSMVRAFYRINQGVGPLPVFSGSFVAGSDLGGFTTSPSNFAVDWDFLLPSPNSTRPIQPSYRIDTSLTASLGLLPLPTTGIGPANLATRNLLRGRQLGLPSGQDVAREMGITPLTDDRIVVGRATGVASDTRSLVSISSEFAGAAPLWTYVLAESIAQSFPIVAGHVVGAQTSPIRLGPVGGRIVAETIVGLLASDPTSIVNHAEATSVRPQSVMRTSGLRDLLDSVRTRPISTPPTTRPSPPPTRPAPPTTSPRPPVRPPVPPRRVVPDRVPPLLRRN